MSNGTLERVFKLWIQLWELVLEEKRHLDAVCAVLQNLVFEFNGYPEFRNWEEICKLSDWCLKMALARADLASPEGKRLQALFPECFTHEKNRGAISLSILQEWSRAEGTGDDIDRSDFLALTGALDYFNVPHIILAVDPRESDLRHGEIGITHEEVVAMGLEGYGDHGECFGTIVKYQGHDYFVAETSGTYEIFLVPVEVLVLD